jgi:hypothetical protein
MSNVAVGCKDTASAPSAAADPARVPSGATPDCRPVTRDDVELLQLLAQLDRAAFERRIVALVIEDAKP